MSERNAQLDRIEQLLLEGNRQRQQAIDLQTLALERQAPLIEAQQRQLQRAENITAGAERLQVQARRMLRVALPVLLVCICVVAWLLIRFKA